MTVEEHANQCRPIVEQKINTLEELIGQRIDNIESHIEEIMRMIENLSNREENRLSRINELQMNMVKLEERLANVEKTMSTNSPKNLLLTGTSILTFLSVLALILQKMLGG